jgi:hypothetical protein
VFVSADQFLFLSVQLTNRMLFGADFFLLFFVYMQK